MAWRVGGWRNRQADRQTGEKQAVEVGRRGVVLVLAGEGS